MRVPTRKSDKIPKSEQDFKITLEKYEKLKKTLVYLKNEIQPKESEEVKILSTTGDYSENAGYQSAKAKLRRTNNRINKIENFIKKADIIEVKKGGDIIEIGSTVELALENLIKKYQILGSSETDPQKGFISYSSPLGSILLRKKVGDSFELNGKKYTITKIL